MRHGCERKEIGGSLMARKGELHMEGMMMKVFSSVCLLLATTCLALVSAAEGTVDIIKRIDGRTIEGTILQENRLEIVYQTESGNEGAIETGKVTEVIYHDMTHNVQWQTAKRLRASGDLKGAVQRLSTMVANVIPVPDPEQPGSGPTAQDYNRWEFAYGSIELGAVSELLSYEAATEEERQAFMQQAAEAYQGVVEHLPQHQLWLDAAFRAAVNYARLGNDEAVATLRRQIEGLGEDAKLIEDDPTTSRRLQRQAETRLKGVEVAEALAAGKSASSVSGSVDFHPRREKAAWYHWKTLLARVQHLMAESADGGDRENLLRSAASAYYELYESFEGDPSKLAGIMYHYGRCQLSRGENDEALAYLLYLDASPYGGQSDTIQARTLAGSFLLERARQGMQGNRDDQERARGQLRMAVDLLHAVSVATGEAHPLEAEAVALLEGKDIAE